MLEGLDNMSGSTLTIRSLTSVEASCESATISLKAEENDVDRGAFAEGLR